MDGGESTKDCLFICFFRRRGLVASSGSYQKLQRIQTSMRHESQKQIKTWQY